MKNVELLAPAGNMDSLKFAIDAGADAVYIGGEKFSARAFSNNFSLEEIKEAIEYAHLRNVEIYVAVNTLILSSEFDECIGYIDELYMLNVDAVIIQDYGLLNVAVTRYPNMEVHASTQMTIDSYEGVKHLEELGVDRVVLAREMTIEEIRDIRKRTSIPLEIFVSGALCVSYSGQCLMSSLIGGRSGNRGTCSQNCRKKYTQLDTDGNKIKGTGDYKLSSRDLLVLDDLEELIALGNVSLKLEGRMKRKEYVKKVVSIFRKNIDSKEVNETDVAELKTLFNREFTRGHLFGDYSINEHRPNHIGVPIGVVVSDFSIKLSAELNQGDGIRVIGDNEFGLNVNMMELDGLLVNSAIKGQVVKVVSKFKPKKGSIVVKTTDSLLIDKLNKEILYKPYDLYMEVSYCGSTLSANMFDDFGYYAYFEKDILEVSDKNHSETFTKQLSKSGDYPFKIDCLGELVEVYAKKSEINLFRREAIEVYMNEKLKRERLINCISYEPVDVDVTNEVSISIMNENQFVEGYNVYSKEMDNYLPIQGRVGKKHYASKEGMISNYSGLKTYEEFSTNFSLNVTNHYSAYFLHKLGAKRVCMSVELNKHQIIDLNAMYISAFNSTPNLELIVYGRLESMIIRHHLEEGVLIDSHNEEYRVVGDELSTIYHSKVMNVINRLDEVPKMNYRLDFTFESSSEVISILNEFKSEESFNDYYGHFDLGI